MEVNTKEDIKLSWETVLVKFDKLIKFAARQQVNKKSIDSALSAEDLYQEGLIKLYDCWKKWCDSPQNKDMDEFEPIFKKSLFREVNKKATIRICIDLEEEMLDEVMPCSTAEDTLERMMLSEGIKQLEELLVNPIAKQLLKELAEPSTYTLYQVWADLKRKEMLKSQGKKVNVPKINTVRMKHIMRSLGITIKQYDNAMAEIRNKSRLVPNLQY